MSVATHKEIIEALIMASVHPVALDKLQKIFISNNNNLEINEIKDIVNQLVEDYKDSGIELKEVGSGWRFQAKSELSDWVAKLYEERPPKYSRALLETLSLIAYRQPITRSEIEDVRGVAVGSNIIKTLIEHEWIKVVGHKEVPGRPALFATTKKFLDHFNLTSITELPPLLEFTESIASDEKTLALLEGQSVPNVLAADLDDEAVIDGYDETIEKEIFVE